jgi:hypothetical protein
VLLKIFTILLVLNFTTYALQSRADSLEFDSSWQAGFDLMGNTRQLTDQSNITGTLEITRATCIKRAFAELMSKIGIVSDNDRHPDVIVSKVQQSARFGHLNLSSDYEVRVSDKAVELRLAWIF